MSAYAKLESHHRTLSQLEHLGSILSWDEATMMPIGSGKERAEAMARFRSLIHEKKTEPLISSFLEQASGENLNDWQKRNLELIQKQYELSQLFEPSFIEKMTRTSLQTELAWREFKKENNWKDFCPLLSELFQLVEESAAKRAEFLKVSPYDALLDQFEEGFHQEQIDPLFKEIEEFLPRLREEILEKQVDRPQLSLKPNFPVDAQKQLSEKLMSQIGFSFERGRLDTSTHPFCGGHPSDIRITTRYQSHDFSSALMGVLHETGHALYEQNLPAQWRTQPVGRSLGMAVHESQSLFVEMQICRGRAFLEFLLPELKRSFPDSATSLSREHLHLLYTQVKETPIRVDADEVSYPLHILMRYQLEKQLFSRQLKIQDLPEAWDALSQKYLGQSQGDRYDLGLMQDIHWACGAFGYFPSYTLGALIAAQLRKALQKERPSLSDEIQRGDFRPTILFLTEKVHVHGRRYSASDLIPQATGKKLGVEDFKEHLKERYVEGTF